jgi:hypothetical protein
MAGATGHTDGLSARQGGTCGFDRLRAGSGPRHHSSLNGSPVDAMSMKFVDDACFGRQMLPLGLCCFCRVSRCDGSLCLLLRSR